LLNVSAASLLQKKRKGAFLAHFYQAVVTVMFSVFRGFQSFCFEG